MKFYFLVAIAFLLVLSTIIAIVDNNNELRAICAEANGTYLYSSKLCLKKDAVIFHEQS